MPTALVWGLVDGMVMRGAPLPPSALPALAAGGWNPLAVTTRPGNGDDGATQDAELDALPPRTGGADPTGAAPNRHNDTSAPATPGWPAAFDPAAVSLGWDHKLRVAPPGHVQCRGWNAHGQADPGDPAPRVARWRDLAALAAVRVLQVAAGERHSLALSDDGRVFAWGSTCGGDLCGRRAGEASYGGERAQNGSQRQSSRGGSPCIDRNCKSGVGEDGRDVEDGNLESPAAQEQQRRSDSAVQPIECVAGPGTEHPEAVVQVAAGGRHSLVLTASGAVLSWGSNLQGQCGIDRLEAPVDVPSPALVQALGGVPIASLSAGASHSVAVSRDGAAYAWGCGLDGELGSGLAAAGGAGAARRHRWQREPPAPPPLGPSPPPAAAVAEAGSVGALLAAGMGASIAIPLLVEGPGLDEEEVVQAACGARHTLLRCASGAVYAFGWNRYGQCCCCHGRELDGHAAGDPCGSGGRTGGGLEGLWGGCVAGAWGCPHGEAIYRPLRVRLTLLSEEEHHHHHQQQQNQNQNQKQQASPSVEPRPPSPSDEPPGKVRRLEECGVHGDAGAAGPGAPVSCVFAGAWHSIVCLAERP